MAFSKAQTQAIMHKDGPMMVLAGPGSGKTTVITHRVQYLTKEYGIDPGDILVITFTRAAAEEMRERYEALTGGGSRVTFGTFHSIFFRILKLAYRYTADNIVREEQQMQFVRELAQAGGLEPEDENEFAASILSEISSVKGERIALEHYYSKNCPDAVFRQLYAGYEEKMRRAGLIDFDDMMVLCLELFTERKDILSAWQRRYRYILIDEFQDIDALQYELMEALCAYHKNLFIVGDPDQTIYTWRGANVKYLLDFDKVFPNVQTIMMMENYRSTPEILAAANSLIAKNGHRIKKDLLPTKPSGEKVVCHFADTQEAEAHWMVGEMKRLHDRGLPLRDMTVLYRAHYVTRAVEEALMHEKIPYTIYSGVQFFDRMEIKDALSYLRMIAYQDDLSFRRIANAPKRNLGKRRMAFLQETAEKEGTSLYVTLKNHLEDSVFSGTKAKQFVDLIERFSHSYQGRPISEVLSDILDKSGYEKALRTEGSQERLDDLAELKQSIYEYETSCGEESTMEHYLAHIALFSNGDVAEQGDKVKLMTVHAAKGLEFPYVFLCGMNEGIFPSRKVRTLPGMEEERRLAFVALTRAEKGLYLSEADGWNFDGSPRYPSRFLLDIDRELLSFTHEVDETLLRETADDVARRDKYLREDDGDGTLPIGQRVRHAVFGEGTVLDVDLNKGAHVIQFDGMGTPRSISLRAKLEKIGP